MSRPPNQDDRTTPRDNALAPWRKKEEDATSFGGWLRQQREIRNLTLREIADSTKIGMRYLEALETDRFERLPAPIFAKGFLRQYARYVGLDPDEVVNFYLQASRPDEEDEDEEPVARRSSAPLPTPTRQSLALLGIVILVLLLVAGLLYFRDVLGGEDRDAAEPPPMAAPVTMPAAELPPEPSDDDGEAQSLQVTLAFTGECWVEATVDGVRRLSELKVQGESVQLEADHRVELTLGEPGNVRVEVNGERFDLDAPAGTVARGVIIDREAAGLPPLPSSPGDGGPGGTADP